MKLITKLLFILLTIISSKTALTQTTLTLVNTYDISNFVEEPSGLAFDKANNQLFIVSDSDDLFRVSTTGELLESYDFPGDLEGVSTYNTQNTLLIAIEDTYEIVVYNYVTDTRTSHTMVYNNQGDSGSGIEGVTYNSNTGEIYFLNEKEPGALIVADSTFKVTNEYELTYAGDYSASFYVEETNELWLGSDNSSAIYKCNTDGGVIETFELTIENDELDKIEGIAIDYANQLLYVVTDGGGELLTYTISNNTLSNNNKAHIETTFSPNPFNNEINISSIENKATITLIDTTGSIIIKETLNTSTKTIKNLNHLASGVYILKIHDTNNKLLTTKKMIKK